MVYLAGDNAPNGMVIHAMGSEYFRTETARGVGVKLGVDASYEDLLAQQQALLDMSEARLRRPASEGEFSLFSTDT